MSPAPNETETLQLVTAFLNIPNPEARRVILAIAEATANGEPVTAEAFVFLTSPAWQR